MNAVLRVLVLAVLLAGGAASLGRYLLVRVPPDRIGVRENRWRGGVEERDFPTGFHVGLPGVHRWHMLDGTTHVLHFSSGGSGLDRPSLELRTKDNNIVQVDVTVTYRIREGAAHRIVLQGLSQDYRSQAQAAVEDTLRSALAFLTSEDWFQTDRRQAAAQRVLPLVAAAFRDSFLEVDDLLIQRVSFEERYERKLQEKQIAHQRALLFRARSSVEAAEARAGLYTRETESEEKRLRAEWNRRFQEERTAIELIVAEQEARTDRDVKQVKATADLESERALSEARLALSEAASQGDELRWQALSGAGGRLYQARRAAQLLNITSVTLDSADPRVPPPIDLDAMVQLLLGAGQ